MNACQPRSRARLWPLPAACKSSARTTWRRRSRPCGWRKPCWPGRRTLMTDSIHIQNWLAARAGNFNPRGADLFRLHASCAARAAGRWSSASSSCCWRCALVTTMLNLQVLRWLLGSALGVLRGCRRRCCSSRSSAGCSPSRNVPFFASASEQRENIEVIVQTVSASPKSASAPSSTSNNPSNSRRPSNPASPWIAKPPRKCWKRFFSRTTPFTTAGSLSKVIVSPTRRAFSR